MTIRRPEPGSIPDVKQAWPRYAYDVEAQGLRAQILTLDRTINTLEARLAIWKSIAASNRQDHIPPSAFLYAFPIGLGVGLISALEIYQRFGVKI